MKVSTSKYDGVKMTKDIIFLMEMLMCLQFWAQSKTTDSVFCNNPSNVIRHL